jgi:hypothetical protein
MVERLAKVIALQTFLAELSAGFAMADGFEALLPRMRINLSASRMGSLRGGGWDGGSGRSGRWALNLNNAPSNVDADTGGRCAR